MTTEPGQPLAPCDPASLARQHLAAIAASLTDQGIPSRLTRLGGTPILTIEEAVGGTDSPTVAIDPDFSNGAGLRLDCTCVWTSSADTIPKTIAATIADVLNAIGPARGGI
jgi:hypothetical protein